MTWTGSAHLARPEGSVSIRTFVLEKQVNEYKKYLDWAGAFSEAGGKCGAEAFEVQY